MGLQHQDIVPKLIYAYDYTFEFNKVEKLYHIEIDISDLLYDILAKSNCIYANWKESGL